MAAIDYPLDVLNKEKEWMMYCAEEAKRQGYDAVAEIDLVNRLELAMDLLSKKMVGSIGDLSLLGEGAVIKTAHGLVMKYSNGHWHATGSTTYWSPLAEWVPALVLDWGYSEP